MLIKRHVDNRHRLVNINEWYWYNKYILNVLCRLLTLSLLTAVLSLVSLLLLSSYKAIDSRINTHKTQKILRRL